MTKIINSAKAPDPIGPYSHSVMAEGKMLFISGQIPFDAEGNLVGNDIEAQTHQCLKNVKAIVEEAGGTMANIAKTTCLLSDMDNFVKMNGVYAEYLGDIKPARAAFGVVRLPKDVMIEIEAIACF